jgi:hypothetical protein
MRITTCWFSDSVKLSDIQDTKCAVNNTKMNDLSSLPLIFTPSQSQQQYSLWVGNIPLGTAITNLRDYFYEAISSEYDLLSISYNPDARYAFVNFGTEVARVAGIKKAAAQLFDGKRLDCRIREGGSHRSTKISYGLRAGQSGETIAVVRTQADNLLRKVQERARWPEATAAHRGKDKYFIIKSNSLEALHQSLGSGQWRVPRRHIERLNLAYQVRKRAGRLMQQLMRRRHPVLCSSSSPSTARESFSVMLR